MYLHTNNRIYLLVYTYLIEEKKDLKLSEGESMDREGVSHIYLCERYELKKLTVSG